MNIAKISREFFLYPAFEYGSETFVHHFAGIEYILKIIHNHEYSFIPVIYSFLYRKLAFTRLFMQKL